MTIIRRLLCLTFFLLTFIFSNEIIGKNNVNYDYYVATPSLSRDNDNLKVNFRLNLRDMNLSANQAIILTPMVIKDNDSIECAPIAVYGRSVWYQMKRKAIKQFPENAYLRIRYDKKLNPLAYEQNLDYANWMNGASLVIKKEFFNCVGCNKGSAISTDLVTYHQPEVKVEERFPMAIETENKKLESIHNDQKIIKTTEACIDFRVNDYIVDSSFNNNSTELSKIKNILESVFKSKDKKIKSIRITATSSPEGIYEMNANLSYRRAVSLKDYLMAHYNIASDDIQTNYKPIDWNGLKEWIESHDISDKSEILAILNSDIPVYQWNTKIREEYPQVYKELLLKAYPELRQATVTIEYY